MGLGSVASSHTAGPSHGRTRQVPKLLVNEASWGVRRNLRVVACSPHGLTTRTGISPISRGVFVRPKSVATVGWGGPARRRGHEAFIGLAVHWWVVGPRLRAGRSPVFASRRVVSGIKGTRPSGSRDLADRLGASLGRVGFSAASLGSDGSSARSWPRDSQRAHEGVAQSSGRPRRCG